MDLSFVLLGASDGSELDSSDCALDGASDVMLEGSKLERPLLSNDGETLGWYESVLLGSSVGGALGSTLGGNDETEPCAIDDFLNGSNDGKTLGLLLGDSLGNNDGHDMGSSYGAFHVMLEGSTLGIPLGSGFTDGESLGSTLAIDDVYDLGSSGGSFDSSNDGKHVCLSVCL